MAKKKVLVVDDHPATRALIRQILEADPTEPMDVVEAASGSECLRTVDKQGPFDLILLDVALPDMDGFSVCRALRTVDGMVPIVFVSGKGELKDYSAGRKAGGDSYLVKPIARGSLRSIVSLFTSGKRKAPAAAEPEKAG
ncbi:MAG TPA: response regulator [Vicinamibacteria bacterium]